MIVPAGKRKEQVNQGPLKNEVFSIHDLFSKVAITGMPDLQDKDPRQQQGGPSSELSQTMQSGGLDHGGMADQLEGDRDPGLSPQNDQNIAPAGGAPTGSPASRFLGPDPDAQGQQTDPNQLWAAERGKIRAFIGNDFGMKLQQGNDGTFTVSLKPPGNMPVQDPTGFMDALLQHIGGGSVNEEDTPAVSDVGGSLILKYRPSGAGPQKIHPPGKGRR